MRGWERNERMGKESKGRARQAPPQTITCWCRHHHHCRRRLCRHPHRHHHHIVVAIISTIVIIAIISPSSSSSSLLSSSPPIAFIKHWQQYHKSIAMVTMTNLPRVHLVAMLTGAIIRRFFTDSQLIDALIGQPNISNPSDSFRLCTIARIFFLLTKH